MNLPTVIIGLDGATWTVMDPLLARGRLPNIASLMETGSYGRIATLPGFTSPALWTSILTGKVPEKHSVSNFYTATGKYLKAKPIYELLGDDVSAGLFQIYAARRTNGKDSFLVPSRVEHSDIAFPSQLSFLAELGSEKNLRHSVRNAIRCIQFGVPLSLIIRVGVLEVNWRLGRVEDLLLNFQRSILGQRVRAHILTTLFQRYRPDMLISLFYVLDHLGHYYWQYREPSRWSNFDLRESVKYGTAIDQAYVEIDKEIGMILRSTPENALIAVVSDHGMEGASAGNGGRPLTIRGSVLLDMLGLSDSFVTELLPPFKIIFRARPPVWSKEDSLRLCDSLRAARLEGGTRPFLVEEPDGQTIELTKRMDVQIDLDSDLVFPSGDMFPLKDIIFEHRTITGMHAHHGILILKGPGIKKSTCFAEAQLTDLVTTILALQGKPLGKDMDGKVLFDALVDSDGVKRNLQFIDSYDENARDEEPLVGMEKAEVREIEQRLRDLGYLA